jgi:hypothetical protein
LYEIPAFVTGWITRESTDTTSTNIAKYSENNSLGARSSQLKLVKPVLRGLGVPLLGFLRIARNRFRASKAFPNSTCRESPHLQRSKVGRDSGKS